MTQKIIANGQVHEFPDDASLEEINESLGNQTSKNNPNKAQMDEVKRLIGLDRTPIDTLQDLGAGLAGGAQRLAVLLGQGGQKLTYALTGGHLPETNVAQGLGLGENNRFDLMDKLASNKPRPFTSSFLKTTGQFLPAILSGGSTLPGQAAAAGLWGATQHVPQTNDIDIGGRVKSGLEDAALTYGGGKIIGGLAKEISGGFPTIKSLMPSIPSKSLLSDLGEIEGGGLANSQENANRIARAINKAAEKEKAEALQHKDIVYEKTAKNRVDVYPENTLPEGNLAESLKELGINPKEVDESQVDAFKKSLQDYRKHNDLDRLQEEFEDIFSKESLTPKQQAKLDELMSIPVKKDLKYLSPKNETNWDAYNGKLKDLHEKFMKSRNFQNAHELESQLNSEIRAKEALSKKGQLDKSGGNDLQSLIRSKKALSADMENILKGLPEDLQSEWKNFKDKYRENYGAYLNKKRPALIEIAKGKTEGVKPDEIKSIFAYPDEKVQKILGDLAPETKKQILFNELTKLDPNNAQSVVDYLNRLEKDQGYAHLITDDIKTQKAEIERRLKRRGRAVNMASLGTVPLGTKLIKTLKLLWNKVE